jgi:hypothetical protein
MTQPDRPEGKIVKAAIKIEDKIYVGWRHFQIRNQIIRETDISRIDICHIMSDSSCDGFVTENGFFLNREQALEYGRSIGQVNKLIGSVLTSEDLWNINGEEHKHGRI